MASLRGIKKEKFRNVELLRFIFSVLIVMFHFSRAFNMSNIFAGIKNSYLCVDFFFIIAGFFLFRTINISQDTLQFAKKKIFRLAPLIWVSLIIFLILCLFVDKLHFKFTDNILHILLLNDIGFGPKMGGIANSVVHWFIPAYFWVSVFYFYLCKIINKKYQNMLMWIIVIFSYSICLNYTGYKSLDYNIVNIYYVFNYGILRALGGIGLGYFINLIYQEDFLQNSSMFLKILITIAEFYLFIVILYYMLWGKHLPARTPIVLIIMFSILFYLFLIKQGLLSKILDNTISTYLGETSYAIYVMHQLIPQIFKYCIHFSYLNNHTIAMYIIQVCCGVLFGVVIHYFVEKSINSFIKTKM